MECTLCRRAGKYIHNGFPYCGLHFRVKIRTEPCCICLENMAHEEISQLSCGHTMHTNCASQCVIASCPLCRQPFGSHLGPRIQYKTRVEPLVEAVYSVMSPDEILPMFNLFNEVKAPSYAFSWENLWVGNICHICITIVLIYQHYILAHN